MSDNVFYVCEQHPSFNFRLEGGRKKFSNGRLDLTEKADIEELDNLIRTNPTFTRLVRKVEQAEAVALVQQHMRSLGGNPVAAKGTVSSQDILDAQKIIDPQNGDMTNITSSQAEELRDKIKKDSGLILTQTVKTK